MRSHEERNNERAIERVTDRRRRCSAIGIGVHRRVGRYGGRGEKGRANAITTEGDEMRGEAGDEGRRNSEF